MKALTGRHSIQEIDQCWIDDRYLYFKAQTIDFPAEDDGMIIAEVLPEQNNYRFEKMSSWNLFCYCIEITLYHSLSFIEIGNVCICSFLLKWRQQFQTDDKSPINNHHCPNTKSKSITVGISVANLRRLHRHKDAHTRHAHNVRSP